MTTDSEHPGLFGGLVASGATLRIAAIRDLPVAEILTAIQAQIRPDPPHRHLPRLVAQRRGAPGQGAAGHGVPVLVDGAQAAGAIPVVAVEELGADFYTVSAQKWLLGPAATGALYVAPERLEDCRVAFPSYFSWKLPDYELRDGASASRTWTPPASVAGLLASMKFAAEAGEERFARARGGRALPDAARGARCRRGYRARPGNARLVAPTRQAVVHRLAEQGVVVRDLPGTGLVRASCGYWTSRGDLERLVRGLLPPQQAEANRTLRSAGLVPQARSCWPGAA